MGLNSARLGIIIRHTATKTMDYSTPVDELNKSISQDFAAGVGSEQGDLVFHDKRTLAGGANESLDLAGGGLTDAFGAALAFAKVRALVIENLSSTKVLTIGNDANPLVFLGAGAHTVVLPPKGKLVLANPVTGWTVTPDTGDKIKVANDAGDPCDYLVWILGTSG
ncbi:MAG: hypothetical protein C4567_12455 [Deltaproteobacteria bacterium]|nr:MAG: hypothetical protein C4567_12455 [Deltaproteobacteria bacterium]